MTITGIFSTDAAPLQTPVSLSFFALTYSSSSWFHPNLPLPNLFCHVTPLIGWHVINSLACSVGCHLHGNKSLLLNVGGGSIQDCVLTFSEHPCLTLINSPDSNLFGPRGVIIISRWQTVLIKHCVSFLWMYLRESCSKLSFSTTDYY